MLNATAAPKPISRQLVMQIAPHTHDEFVSHNSTPRQNAPRQAYPPELLTHRFMPYGSLVPEEDADEMEVDKKIDEADILLQNDETVTSVRVSKAKKRKGDDSALTPPKIKKPKKHTA